MGFEVGQRGVERDAPALGTAVGGGVALEESVWDGVEAEGLGKREAGDAAANLVYLIRLSTIKWERGGRYNQDMHVFGHDEAGRVMGCADTGFLGWRRFFVGDIGGFKYWEWKGVALGEM